MYFAANKSIKSFNEYHIYMLGLIQDKEKIKTCGSYLKELTALYF